MDTANRSNTFVQSVDRAISVMEFLSRRGWSGVTEVANELNIHKSTAYRLLTTLRDRGLVEQDAATEKYRLGFGLVLLASAVRADLAEKGMTRHDISLFRLDRLVRLPGRPVSRVDRAGREEVHEQDGRPRSFPRVSDIKSFW